MRKRSLQNLAISLLVLLSAVALTGAMAPAAQPGQSGNSVIHDWSMNHVIYPDRLPPGQQSKFENNPRWINQQRLRYGRLLRSARGNSRGGAGGVTERDWAVGLGSGASGNDGIYPAKYTFDFAAVPDCTRDFIVFPVNALPGLAQPNIVGFNNLYRGPASGFCGTGDPNTLWAYRIGNGPIRSSPALSLDGTRLAFVESSSTGAVFHVLTWKQGQGTLTNPVVPEETVVANVACTPGRSCDVSIPYTTSTNSLSSVYIDYAGNNAWVGADDGYLYRIREVFSLSPKFNVTLDKFQVNPGFHLTSPVYDSNVDRVLISDGTNLYAVPAQGGTATSYTPNPALGTITDGPILDFRMPLNKPPFTNVWLFGNARLMEMDYPWTSPFTFNVASANGDSLGSAPSGFNVRMGAFTEGVYNPTFGAAGYVYVCGNQSPLRGPIPAGSQNLPRIYRFNIAGEGKLTTGDVKTTDVGTAAGHCSPLAYSYMFSGNQLTEMLFAGYAVPSPAGEILRWDISSAGGFEGLAPTHRVGEPGGTSAIVLDNYATTTEQAQSIYFSTLAPSSAGGNPAQVCAVKLTQVNMN